LEVKRQKVQWSAVALLLVNMIYGASHVLAKGVMPQYLSPTVFIGFRVFGALLLFWGFSFFIHRIPIERNDLPRLIACGLFGITVNQLLFFQGLNASSPMNAGIIMAINPIMVAVLSFFWLGERLVLKQWFGILIGSIGATALTVYGSSTFEARLGDWLLFGNSLSYAVYLILVKPLMAKYPPIQVITWVFTFGSIFLLMYPPLYFDLAETSFNPIPTDAWLKIIFVVVAVTFITYLLTVIGLKYVSSTIASVFIYVQPIFVVGFTFLFAAIGWSKDYTRSINFTTLCFMIIVFIGVFLSKSSKA
jgi:drug/metabolite transporter (DMT)-like permease